MNFKKIKDFYLRLPIKIKVAALINIILVVSLILLAITLYQSEKKIIISEMLKRGKIILNNLAQTGFEALLNEDKTITSDAISKIMKNEEYNIVYAIVVDKNNKIFDHSDIKEIGKIYPEKITNLKISSKLYKNENILELSSPINITVQSKNVKIGAVIIGISKKVLKKAVSQALIRTILFAIIFTIIGLFLSFNFAGNLTSPIRKIADTMIKVGEGDLEQKVEVPLKDEIGILANSFNEMIKHLREKIMMSKYVSKSTIEMISKKSSVKLELGGERKTVTMLFSDIRGFTSFSENKAPEDVINMLNKYLSIQAEIIEKNNGEVDKFVGDEVVAIFKNENMIQDCVKSAIEIQRKINEINQKEKNNIFVGIGIHIGEVVMGNMGSPNRMDYTVIGDAVNTTSRLCSIAEPKKIVVSEDIYKNLKGKYKFSEPSEIKLKGKSVPLKIYELLY